MERSGSGNPPRSDSVVAHQGSGSGSGNSAYTSRPSSDDPRKDPAVVSVNFGHALDPTTRAERAKRMAQHHPAMAKSRDMNETLVSIQQSLRKMPGISSREADEMIDKLKSVDVTVSKEMSQLVDAMVNMKLDNEDGQISMSRVTLQASLNKAGLDDQSQRVKDLSAEMEEVKSERDELMRRVAEELEDKREVSDRLKDIERWYGDHHGQKKRGNTSSGSATASMEMIKRLDETIKILDAHLTERRPVWISQGEGNAFVARSPTIVTPFSSKASERVYPDNLNSRHASWSANPYPTPPSMTGSYMASDYQMGGNSTALTPYERPSSVASSRYGVAAQGCRNQQAGMSQGRSPSRFGQWGAMSAAPTPHPRPQTNWPAYQSPMGRGAPLRQGGHHGTWPRYQGNARENAPSTAFSPAETSNGWRSTSNGNGPSPPRYKPTAADNSSVRYSNDPHKQHAHHYQQDKYAVAIARAPQQSTEIHMSEQSIAAWRDQIGAFYDAIRCYVNGNCIDPDEHTFETLKNMSLFKSILHYYNSLNEQHALTFLKGHLMDSVAKPCLVTRAVVDFVVNYVWAPGAWVGFDDESSLALAEIKGGLDGSKGQPSFTKQPYLDRLAAVIDTMMKQPTAKAFRREKIIHLASGLYAHVGPVANSYGNSPSGAAALERVAELALDLSVKILTSRLTFDFRFPDVGNRFSSQCMVAIWPDMDPAELVAKHWRVALVATPVVTCRNDTGNSISAHSIVHADVFCMQ